MPVLKVDYNLRGKDKTAWCLTVIIRGDHQEQKVLCKTLSLLLIKRAQRTLEPEELKNL